MRTLWAIFCRYSIVDELSKKMSLIEVIDVITLAAPVAESQPQADIEDIEYFRGSLVVQMARSNLHQPEKSKIRVRLVAPNGDEAIAPVQEVDLTESSRIRLVAQLVGLPLSQSMGEYTFKIDWQTEDHVWEESYSLPLWVELVKRESG